MNISSEAKSHFNQCPTKSTLNFKLQSPVSTVCALTDKRPKDVHSFSDIHQCHLAKGWPHLSVP